MRPALPTGSSSAGTAFEAPLEFPASTTRPLLPSTRLVAARNAGAVPPRAAGGYQLAEAVLATADGTCHLQWELLAAIGAIESDHGRHGGGSLDTQGAAHPAIIGPALDGAGDFAAVADTDGGAYDRDSRWDRAVGPMQFLPTTWTEVGVDADGDGSRNPQDIDDAALGAAVYLCSGEEDLATVAGREKAIFRYNNDPAYVDAVLRLFTEYAATTAPTSLVIAAARLDDSANTDLRSVAASPARGPQVPAAHPPKGPAPTPDAGTPAPGSGGKPVTEAPAEAPQAATGDPAMTQPGPALDPCPTTPTDPASGSPEPQAGSTTGPWIDPDAGADGGPDESPDGTASPADLTDPAESPQCPLPVSPEPDPALEPAGATEPGTEP